MLSAVEEELVDCLSNTTNELSSAFEDGEKNSSKIDEVSSIADT